MTNDRLENDSDWALQALFDLPAENCPAIFWQTDTDLTVIWKNGPGLDVDLHNPVEAVGKSLVDVFHIKDNPTPVVRAHERALRGDCCRVEFRLAGELFRGRIIPIQEGGKKVSGCIGYAQRMVSAGDIELGSLFGLSRQMICIAGADGYFRRVSPGFERALGFSSEELLSRPFFEFVHPDDREATVKEVDKLARGGLTGNVTNRYRTKGGSYRWLTWSIISNPDGLLYAAATDVTELKSSQELSDSLLYHAPDPVIITDKDGRILRVNGLVTSVFGYDQDELVGKPIEILVPERLRGAHVGHRGGYSANPHVRSMGAGIELLAVRRDGTEFPAEVSLGPVETDDGTITICSVRDISERKRAERVHLEQRGELLAAEKIQQRLRPQSDPLLPGFDIGGECRPCVYAAGDLYDFFAMPGETTGIVVGDVTGHGFSSALLMASTQAHIRSIVNSGLHIDQIVERTNAAVEKETDNDRFVTLFFGRLDHKTGAFTYVNAGHPTGYVVGGSGEIKSSLESTGIPIGVHPEAKYPIGGSIVLERGDVLVLPTDGILEAASPSDEEFGDERLLQIVRENRERSARDIIGSILSSSLRFSRQDQLEDDATVVVVKCHRTPVIIDRVGR